MLVLLLSAAYEDFVLAKYIFFSGTPPTAFLIVDDLSLIFLVELLLDIPFTGIILNGFLLPAFN